MKEPMFVDDCLLVVFTATLLMKWPYQILFLHFRIFSRETNKSPNGQLSLTRDPAWYWLLCNVAQFKIHLIFHAYQFHKVEDKPIKIECASMETLFSHYS